MANSVPTMSRESIRDMVRAYMRDHAELNRLITGVETGDRLMDTCIALAIDHYNVTGAPVSATFANFPSLKLLLLLTICEVLESVILLKARNNLSYSDGGFQVNNEGNVALYEGILQRMRASANALLDNVKVSVNIMQNFGDSVSSEYAWLSGWTSEYFG